MSVDTAPKFKCLSVPESRSKTKASIWLRNVKLQCSNNIAKGTRSYKHDVIDVFAIIFGSFEMIPYSYVIKVGVKPPEIQDSYSWHTKL